MDMKQLIPAIHREGYLFIAIFAVVTACLAMFSNVLGTIGIILTVWCVFFFRDPARVTPANDDFVISPADGLVSNISLAAPPEELEMGSEPRTKVSIFLSVFDVHVNRIPAKGTITKLNYRPGKFLNATLDKASVDNERQSVCMTTENNQQIAFVQIAGLIARRIVCDLSENQQVQAGERFGIIRFGSRMDVYLPDGVNPLVIEGQRVIGGETVLANLASGEEQRKGEVR